MALSWAQKRKSIYIGSALVVFVVLVVIPLIFKFYTPPTCSDGKKNGDELGIDCGGGCSLLCSVQYVPLNVMWQRFSKVNDGVYNVLAYIENPNLNAGANDFSYQFKLYDKDGVLLNERFGRTFAPANKVFAVFEPDLLTGKQTPYRLEFNIVSEPVWLKQTNKESALSITQAVLTREDTAPRLTAQVSNKTIYPIGKIEAVAIIYDTTGNAVAFSRTIIEGLDDKETKEINFNWPKPFGTTVARNEVIVKILN